MVGEKDLEGLPNTVIEAAKIAARNKGNGDKWLITGHFPSFSPFMQYSSRRDLRKKVHVATSANVIMENMTITLCVKKYHL